MNVLVTEFMNEAALEEFGSGFNINYQPKLVDDRTALLGEVASANAIIVRNRTQVDAELLIAAPKLKAVGRLGVGLDNIDVPACTEKGIAVLPATGANAISVAEYVIGTALSLTRGAFTSNDEMIEGHWPRAQLGNGGEVFGRQLGLLGFGTIAQQVAKRALSLGMRVAAYDPFLPSDDAAWTGVENLEIDQLLRTSDIVSLHVPLTEKTRNLIDATELQIMKSNAILINTARGGIVNEPSLIAALKSNKIAGAALDVFEHEPLDRAAGARFANCPNLILTPHIAGVTAEGNERVSALTVANVKAALSEAKHG